MYKTSLKKSVLLLALALPATAIAVDLNQHLSFDYKVPDTDNVADLRTGLQAMACHSRGDPMDILIKFKKFHYVTPKLTFKVDISGADYSKSYAVFQPGSATKSAHADPDFLIPWGVTVTGQVTGKEGVMKLEPATKTKYKDAFCFDRGYSVIGTGRNEFSPSGGWVPVYNGPCTDRESSNCTQTHGYGGLRFGYCDGLNIDNNEYDSNYYWPRYDNPNQFIQNRNNNEPDFLFKHRFFKNIVPGSPGIEKEVSIPFGISKVNQKFTDKNFSYVLPVGNPNNRWLNIDGGSFLLKLHNRNISRLKLTVTDVDGIPDIWEWTAPKGDALSNTLSLVHTKGSISAVAGPPTDPDDAYAASHFYAGNNDYYKGTLAAVASLNLSAYTNFITKTVPLSRPVDSQGSINLVNTDNLVFTIEQNGNNNGTGSLMLSVYGQPLKFGPLKVRNKPVATAMQLRNACY